MKQTTPPITVRELIAALQQLPADAYVFTEGCDCEGPCSEAVLSKPGYVRLSRDDSRKVPDANPS